MKNTKQAIALASAAALSVGMLAGCGSEQTAESSDGQDTVTGAIIVSAAASLTDVLNELAQTFQEEYPGTEVSFTFGGSGALQTQIEEGLEADVFMSAATKQMKALDDEGMIASDSIVNLLENKIVLIVPAGSDSKIDSFEKIGDAASIALGDPESVPAGQYAKEALTNLNVWDSIQDKVSFGTNVTEVLNQVAAASADAGIVYATDAASKADQVTVVAEAPEGSLEKKVIYPVAVVKATTHEDAAKAFVDFLQTPEAIAVFESYGFVAAE